MKSLSNTHYPRERFSVGIISVREDVSKYAEITSGVKIELRNATDIINRWNEKLTGLLQ
ncbi:hypothetical protein WKH54_25765 [Priestia megaterium]|uniref:hypothetical protein n=1 Tax=Priestia megaterium TaxID=1404 RepID=UPI0031769976